MTLKKKEPDATTKNKRLKKEERKKNAHKIKCNSKLK